ncbi:MAG: YchJ family protein [Bdellovibrionaceae bacterium]|nr:YchJ family protein [Bdellovibrio sp.]
MKCPCQSTQEFSSCCEPYLKGSAKPDTAEKLMRSRYSAYAKADIEYIRKTLAPESRTDFDIKSTREWAQQAQWKGLQILSTELGGPNDKKGTVEFTATYEYKGEGLDHHEVAQFRKNENDEWLFVEGDSHTHPAGQTHDHHHAKPVTVQREGPKIGRNDPCTCGSGKKYKKCCGAEASA